jgi:hypothetical protein
MSEANPQAESRDLALSQRHGHYLRAAQRRHSLAHRVSGGYRKTEQGT